jgi:hypothetical protein
MKVSSINFQQHINPLQEQLQQLQVKENYAKFFKTEALTINAQLKNNQEEFFNKVSEIHQF